MSILHIEVGSSMKYSYYACSFPRIKHHALFRVSMGEGRYI